MAEGLEAAYHVPQQSRREKLRDPRLLYDIPPPPPPHIPSDFQIDPSTLHILNNTPFFNNHLQPHPLSLSLPPPNDDVVSSSSSSSLLLPPPPPPPPSYAAASFLKASRFLVPAQQLLDDLCHVGQPRVSHAPDHFDTTSFIEPPSSLSPSENFASGDASQGCWKKSRLLTMLDEVYKRYMQYYQQIQAVVSSFEYVSGLSNAAPYATLAIRAMFKHFKSLKNVITDQLQQFTNSNSNNNKGGYNFHNISNKINDGGGQIIRATTQNQNPEFVGHQQPIWRPQRGLPERAVTVLRAWLFDHFLHPYPTDSDKIMLAKQTGLSRSQVSNWFINARVRVWKPMVEEIHMLETRQQQQSHHQKNNNPDHHQHQNQTHHHQIINNNNNNNITKEQNKYFSTCDTKFEDSPFKRTRNIYNPPPNNNDNNNLGAVTNNGVSLTLGLHQNNGGLALPEPSFPIEAHRFGLHSDHQAFVVSASQDSNIESSLWKRNLL